ncbi:MAG: hypothetical protein IIT68_03165 [Treponema sp.]|nr:hypothetical protein [Treponema sp.]
MKNFCAFIFSMLFFVSCQGYVVVSNPDDPSFGQESPGSERELTLVVYLAADNNLESAALEDMNEMEAAICNPLVTVLALIDRSPGYDTSDGNWSGTRLYEIVHDADGMNRTLCSKRIDCPVLGVYANRETELDMGSETTLCGILSFAKNMYPARQYGLVMWGHGTGWRSGFESSVSAEKQNAVRAFAIDDTSHSYLALSKLRNAIDQSMEGTKLLFIGFDTCFGFEFEVAYELRNCALWLCGCEGTEANSGWNYKQWFDSFLHTVPDGKEICMMVSQQFSCSADWSFGIADLSKIENAFICFDRFAQLCSSCVSTKTDLQKLHGCFNQAQSFCVSGIESDLYVNVCSLTECLMQAFPLVKENGLNTLYALQNCLTSFNDGKHFALGVYVCDIDANGNRLLLPQNAYTKGTDAENQCSFVRDSAGYVPTVSGLSTLLDKLFNTEI